MDFSAFYDEIRERLRERSPEAAATVSATSLATMVSPYVVALPENILAQARSAVAAFYRLSRAPEYVASVAAREGEWLKSPSAQAAVLMAYDFHVDLATARLGLIEINTNAAGFLVSVLLGADSTHFPDPVADLVASFREEMATGARAIRRLAIVDADPRGQKMYPEFLMYRDLFRSLGHAADIHDPLVLTYRYETKTLADPAGETIDFVYNRLTDFLLEEPSSRTLKAAYENRSAVLSPHPREYLLLADKRRLVELSRPGRLSELGAGPETTAAIDAVLLKTLEPGDFESAEALWARRKSYFFKPQRSYGAKATYRGESITRKVFDRILADGTLVQEFMPAGEIVAPDGRQAATWKFDLRCYAYRDRIQHVTARLYQGQVTNFRQAHGGFARVVWT